MLSKRARIALWVVKKWFNINPRVCKDQIAKLKRLNGPDRYKAPVGWTREKHILGEGSALEFVKPPKADDNKRLVFVIHGGAYVAGLSDIYRLLSKRYSDAAEGGAIAFLEYRCAPDYKFPNALDDAVNGWDKLIELGYKPSDIVVIGDSAGGNLTLALLLKLRDGGRELPRAAVCMSPWADMTASGESYRKNYNLDPMFGGDEEVCEEDVDKLLNSDIFSFIGDNDRTDPYVSPVYGDYHGFPPMMLLAGSTELLLSDTLTIADKLKAAGVTVEVVIGERMYHVWPLFNRLFPEAKKAMDGICAFIKKSYQG